MIYFTIATKTIELPNPEKNNRVEVELRQAIGRSDGGDVYVYDKGVDGIYNQTLKFNWLDIYQMTALRDFFENYAEGALNTFTYIDMNGVSMTARFMSTNLAVTEHHNDFFSISLNLEVSSISPLHRPTRPLLVCNMEVDIDDINRHPIYRSSTGVYKTDHYRFGSSSFGASAGSGVLYFMHSMEDFALDKRKRTVGCWIYYTASLSLSEKLYPIDVQYDANNRWYILVECTNVVAGAFDIQLMSVVAGIVYTASFSTTMLSGLMHHLEVSVDVEAATIQIFLNGTLLATIMTVTNFMEEIPVRAYCLVEGTEWRIDSLALFTGIKHTANFAVPTAAYSKDS